MHTYMIFYFIIVLLIINFVHIYLQKNDLTVGLEDNLLRAVNTITKIVNTITEKVTVLTVMVWTNLYHIMEVLMEYSNGKPTYYHSLFFAAAGSLNSNFWQWVFLFDMLYNLL